jgi:hypothetical protein
MDLHERLIALQSDEELERKAKKAWRKGYYTLEHRDAVFRRANRLYAGLQAAIQRAKEANPPS